MKYILIISKYDMIYVVMYVVLICTLYDICHMNKKYSIQNNFLTHKTENFEKY